MGVRGTSDTTAGRGGWRVARLLGPVALVPRDARRLEGLLVAGRSVLLAAGVVRLAIFDADRLAGPLRSRLVLLFLVAGIVNVVLAVALSRWPERFEVAWPGLVVWCFDAMAVSLAVLIYGDEASAISWPLLVLIPTEGAVRFQVAGGLAGAGATTIPYLLVPHSDPRGEIGDLELLTVRMGLVLILTVLLGLMSRDLAIQRRRNQAALEEARRVEEWRGRLISTLGHDLRSPLGMMQSTAQLLAERGEDLEVQTRRDLHDTLMRQTARARGLADQILDLARFEHGSLVLAPGLVAVADVVTQALALLPPTDQVRVDLPPGLTVRADRDRLAQVLLNLISNGLRHGAPPVTITARADDSGWTEIAVADHGDGVPPEIRENMFTAFATGGPTASVGLGLWIAHAFVHAHGGSLTYQPASTGARFVIRLPSTTLEPAGS